MHFIILVTTHFLLFKYLSHNIIGYILRDNGIILNITVFTKITTNVLHGSPSRTLLYVINAILSTHVRVQILKSVCEVQVLRTVVYQHVLNRR